MTLLVIVSDLVNSRIDYDCDCDRAEGKTREQSTTRDYSGAGNGCSEAAEEACPVNN